MCRLVLRLARPCLRGSRGYRFCGHLRLVNKNTVRRLLDAQLRRNQKWAPQPFLVGNQNPTEQIPGSSGLLDSWADKKLAMECFHRGHMAIHINHGYYNFLAKQRRKGGGKRGRDGTKVNQ